jgi:hypothetical protein
MVAAAARAADDRGMTKRQSENDRIARMARSAADPLPFLCECGRDDCLELIWLSPAELAAHRRDGRRAVAHPVLVTAS